MPPTNEDAVCVIGLGYVGSVVTASLASAGQTVIGVDRSSEVVDAINGDAPVSEPGVRERLERGFALGTLTCTTDLAAAIPKCRASLICVGTPLGSDGLLVEDGVLDVCEQIARAIPPGADHVIVVRSTVRDGHYGRAIERLRAHLGDAVGTRVCLALNPEFLREGSAVTDMEQPELIVYATEHEGAVAFVEDLYADNIDRLCRTDPATSAMLKLVNNAWHALKVSFANEVARIAAPAGVDPFSVMELLCRDTRLNTSRAYLRPGMPFGGSCLTKDVASLSSHATRFGVSAPVIGSILASNDAHQMHLLKAVLSRKPKHVALVGVGFKLGAPDVRDSSAVKLVGQLLERGVHVTAADSTVSDGETRLSDLQHALGDTRALAAPSVAAAIEGADLIVAGHPGEADRATLVELRPTVPVLDASGDLTRKLSDAQRAALSPVVVLSEMPQSGPKDTKIG